MAGRWDGFLAQIASRHGAVIAEAETTAQPYLDDVRTDVVPLSHALMGVHARLLDLESKIVDTWHAKSGEIEGDQEREYAKGIALQRGLADRREELEPRLFAEIARRRYAAGLGESVAALAAHAVAQVAAVVEWRRMRAAEHALHDLRPPRPLGPIVAVEAANLAYWRAYLTVRAQFEPILARDLAMEIRARMEPWYVQHAEYEDAWVRAGRKRLAV